MLYTSLKKGEYSAQITPYGGKVNAEIVSSHESYYDDKTKLWCSVMNKSFGRTFADEPRIKDWEKAQSWIKDQLDNIEKYSTVTITKPIWLVESESSVCDHNYEHISQGVHRPVYCSNCGEEL